jgi:tRNA-dihydrouridine synthase
MMRLMLAPMEGVIDHNLRELLTAVGGLDRVFSNPEMSLKGGCIKPLS